MRWGVSFPALLANLVFTMEAFLATRSLQTLLICVPIHSISALLCARDPRCFELLALFVRMRLPGVGGALRSWRANSYSTLPTRRPGRRGAVHVPWVGAVTGARP
jgi:type IV secretion system protein VirB3